MRIQFLNICQKCTKLTWRKNSFPSTRVRPVCDPTEDLSSNIPLEVEKEIAWRLGDTGLDDVLVGDTNADILGGEPGGVIRGVLV